MKTSPHLQERSFAGAVRDTVLSPLTGSVAAYAVVLVMCATPLYLMGYQNGRFGALGWFLGFALGGLGATVIMFWAAESVNDDEAGIAICEALVRRAYIVGIGISLPMFLYAKSVVDFDIVTNSTLLTAVFTNTWVWWWKPLAQVCAVAAAVIFLGYAQMANTVGRLRSADPQMSYAAPASLPFLVVCGILTICLALVPVLGLFGPLVALAFVFRLADGARPVS